ncbi:hypothetical protein V8G54_018580 [Vigna mungo]|uniref:Uncharacterized protein n=1 Tax=Vigna mungo TaxID=3915 RepID=A0AAQ3N8M3_VIGMU
MASTSAKNDLVMGEKHRHSWPSLGYEQSWTSSPLLRSGRSKEEDNEEDLKWAAIERLPTLDRIRKGLLRVVLDDGKILRCQVDVDHLRLQDKKHLLDSVLKFVDDDNEKFLRKLRDRIDRLFLSVITIIIIILLLLLIFFDVSASNVINVLLGFLADNIIHVVVRY